MNVQIRKATLDDVNAIIRLNDEMQHYDSMYNQHAHLKNTPQARAYFTQRVSNPNAFVIVAQTDKINGYLLAYINPEDHIKQIRAIAEIENMTVEESLRSQGIGQKLVEAFDVWRSEKGIEHIRVVASAANLRAVKFYEKLGLKSTSVILEATRLTKP